MPFALALSMKSATTPTTSVAMSVGWRPDSALLGSIFAMAARSSAIWRKSLAQSAIDLTSPSTSGGREASLSLFTIDCSLSTDFLMSHPAVVMK